jgi:hypothetical protein
LRSSKPRHRTLAELPFGRPAQVTSLLPYPLSLHLCLERRWRYRREARGSSYLTPLPTGHPSLRMTFAALALVRRWWRSSLCPLWQPPFMGGGVVWIAPPKDDVMHPKVRSAPPLWSRSVRGRPKGASLGVVPHHSRRSGRGRTPHPFPALVERG